jgi:hypothetical protein
MLIKNCWPLGYLKSSKTEWQRFSIGWQWLWHLRGKNLSVLKEPRVAVPMRQIAQSC